ncbi:AraC family transcriptional regulator [Nocardiopsis sp. RSe5-2]|uniref:AraC family transcriptional regulator n=1 Tax=Nocardiopsis endophytica TaxID=3018445 RepID=A0ABT4UA39_9ACTN|nr:AraC family transcriptional regulator [Nocardiopsis endophytica]MDA2813819.1 AraC family transcriptional regulator [Nocardiopsis endophytica]
MDELAGLLDGPRARGAFLLRVLLASPWSLRVEDEAPLTLVLVVRGTAHLLSEDAKPVHLSAGDAAVVLGPAHYTVADPPDTPARIVIGPDQQCTTLHGRPLRETLARGVRTWGDEADLSTTEMLVGTYRVGGEVGRRLLGALPAVAALRAPGTPADAAEPVAALGSLLRTEIDRDAPGQEVVLDRLLDLLLIAVLRAWLARRGADAPGWVRARADPVAGRALSLLHGAPGRPWTVAALAAACGCSRSVLARRFTGLVGEPPMAYLTGLRLAMAADLLRDGDATLEAVARTVGYGSPFALSTAFKRAYGVSPAEYRRG